MSSGNSSNSSERIVDQGTIDSIKKFFNEYRAANTPASPLDNREKLIKDMEDKLKSLSGIDKYSGNADMDFVFSKMQKMIDESKEFLVMTKKYQTSNIDKNIAEIKSRVGIESNKPNSDKPNINYVSIDKEDCDGIGIMSNPNSNNTNNSNTNDLKVSIKSYTPMSPVRTSIKQSDGTTTVTRQVDINNQEVYHALMVTRGDADPQTYAVWKNMQNTYQNQNNGRRVIYRHLNLSRPSDYAKYTKLQPYLMKYGSPNVSIGSKPVFYRMNILPNGMITGSNISNMSNMRSNMSSNRFKPTAGVPGSTTETVRNISVIRMDGGSADSIQKFMNIE